MRTVPMGRFYFVPDINQSKVATEPVSMRSDMYGKKEGIPE